MVRVALELVPTPVDMLDSDTPQGIVGYARDGVSEHLFIAREWFVERGPCAETMCMLMFNCPLLRPLSNMRFGPVACVGSG